MKTDYKFVEYGRFSSEFEYSQLFQLCIEKNGVQTGPFGSQLHKEDYVAQGTPIITVEHLGDNRIIHIDTPFVTDDDKNRLQKYQMKEGDIIFSRVGSVDRRALVRKDEDGWLFSGRCLCVRVDKTKINPTYLSYFFGLESFKKYIRGIAVGATMPSINTKILSDVPVYYPKNLNQQKQIAKILSDLDDKIHLNNQINQTLESIAQAIFKSWFIDFEPVRAKISAKQTGQDPELAAMYAISGKSEAELEQMAKEDFAELQATAALFPDELVESELGEVPRGWGVGCVKDIATAKGGYAFKGSQFVEKGYPVIKIKNITGDGKVDIQGTQCIDEKTARNAAKFMLHDCDLVMAMTGATVGKIGLVNTHGKSIYLNQRVAKFESEKFGGKISYFLFCLFNRKEYFEQIVGTAQGSAQPNISSSGIESTSIIVPNFELINLFIKNTDSIFQYWLKNGSINNFLNQSRDTLLPKLLSGELDVSGLQGEGIDG